MQMRVQEKSEDVGRCGCGRREKCDGSHGYSAEQWAELQRKELEKVAELSNN